SPQAPAPRAHDEVGEHRARRERAALLDAEGAADARGAALALLAEHDLDDAVAAVRRDRAGGGTHAESVGRFERDVERAVVALLGAVHGAISAVRRQRAVGVAGAVAAIIDAVVALLERHGDDAVAAGRHAARTIRLAVAGHAVVSARTVIAYLVAFQHAVAADRTARGRDVGEPGQRQPVGRRHRVALGLAHVDRVHATIDQ